ncbi:MAG: hypothetical protein ACHQ9S_06870 [Candidatus Binatia bacterium]
MRRRLLALAVLLSLVGCLWRSYAEIMSVHVDVLTQTAAKLCTVVEAGKGPTAEDMAEYLYPLKRGREFLNQFSNYSDRQSYRQFSTFLDRYEAMVRAADAARAQGREPSELPRVSVEREALQHLAAEIRNELKAGR